MGPPRSHVIAAEFAATVVRVDVAADQVVEAGGSLLVLEAMKMEHVITAPVSGVATGLTVAVGDTVSPGAAMLTISPMHGDHAAAVDRPLGPTSEEERPDLVALIERKRMLDDGARPEAVAERHAGPAHRSGEPGRPVRSGQLRGVRRVRACGPAGPP